MNTSPTHENDTSAELRALMPVNQRPSAMMVRGEGAWLFDAQGTRYLDFVQGWAVNSFGHCPALVRDALAEQASQLVNASPAYHTLPQHALARELCAASGMQHAFFTSSGAEANEGAIKLARKWGQLKRGGACEIITTQGSFHGRTLATMAASGKPGFDALFPPSMPGFVKVPFGDVAAVERAINERTVAVLLEPIQGEAGVVVPPEGYLRELRALTTARGVLLMLDEVQVGMGRTGTLFCFQHEGVQPDVLTLGKGLGAGVPLGALLATREASCFAPGDQGGTFSGHPLMTAVGVAVLRAIQEPGFLDTVLEASRHLREGLTRASQRYGACEVRGRGLLLALTLPAARGKQVVDAAFAQGLLINSPQPELLRFMPALNVTHEQIDSMLGRLDRALADGLHA